MTNLPQPATAPPADPAVPTTPFSEPWLERLRRAMGWASGKPILMSGFSISREQAKAIEHRRLTLRKAITGTHRERSRLIAELAAMLAGMPAPAGLSDLAADLRIHAYMVAIGDQPAWAVSQACRAIIRGETEHKRYAPTPPQLAAMVRDIVRPLRRDLEDLDALARIEPNAPPSPGEVARVASGFDDLRRELQPSKNEATVEAVGEGPFARALRDMAAAQAAAETVDGNA